jgi:hypothetical protein
MAEQRRNIIKEVYENPRTGFGNLAETLRLARQREPRITRDEVRSFLDSLVVREDRPQRKYNSFVPYQPMHQLQVDLADMTAFAQGPYKFMLVAIDTFTKKLTAVPMKDKQAATAARAWDTVVKDLGIPAYVYSDDGSEFKSAFKQKLDYFDVDKIVTRGHAPHAERAIRTLKEALVRRLTAGVGRRNQWHLLLPDVLAQYNERRNASTGVTPNQAYEDPDKADKALANMKRRAKKDQVVRAEIRAGDLVRIRVKPLEARGSYRVTEMAWTERVYQVSRVESTAAGPLFTVEGWSQKLVARDLLKVSEERQRRFPMQSRELRGRRPADIAVGPVAPP